MEGDTVVLNAKLLCNRYTEHVYFTYPGIYNEWVEWVKHGTEMGCFWVFIYFYFLLSAQWTYRQVKSLKPELFTSRVSGSGGSVVHGGCGFGPLVLSEDWVDVKK